MRRGGSEDTIDRKCTRMRDNDKGNGPVSKGAKQKAKSECDPDR